MPENCNDCPLRATCTQPCEDIRRILPDEDHGRAHALHRRNALEAARRMHAELHAARVMTDYRHVLRGRAREVFDLTYNDALLQSEIAQRLGISRRVVSIYLTRARKKIAGQLQCVRR